MKPITATHILLTSIALMFFSQILQAETYVREYTYKASEADSKITSRKNALDQVKLILLQEIGTHIRQQINITKNSSGSTYGGEDIEAITAGFAQVNILKEDWDGNIYYIKVEITADTQRVLNALDEFRKAKVQANQKQQRELKEKEAALKQTRKELDRVRQQLKQAREKPQPLKDVSYTLSSNPKKYVGEYVSFTGVIDQVIFSKKGYIYLNMGGKYPNHKLSLVVFKNKTRYFNDAKKYEGKRVKVHGKVSIYKNRYPQLILNNASQINII